jgi:uncharacterized protein
MTNTIKIVANSPANTPANTGFSSTHPARSPIASPCISVCVMDAASGYCTGCLRTIDEIAAWGQADERFKSQVLHAISERKVA